MKRLAIALAAIGLSTSTLAATYNPTDVTVPSLDGGLVIGVTGLYLQPSVTNGGGRLR